MDDTENPAASAAQRSFLSIGLLGFGTVGAQVYRLLRDETLVAARAGVSMRVKKIAVLHVALAAAQRQGFAEADPREDIEGHDAAAKLAILASAAFGCQVTNDDVYREGIASIQIETQAPWIWTAPECCATGRIDRSARR